MSKLWTYGRVTAPYATPTQLTLDTAHYRLHNLRWMWHRGAISRIGWVGWMGWIARWVEL